jgi:hypothetical protein
METEASKLLNHPTGGCYLHLSSTNESDVKVKILSDLATEFEIDLSDLRNNAEKLVAIIYKETKLDKKSVELLFDKAVDQGLISEEDFFTLSSIL